MYKCPKCGSTDLEATVPVEFPLNDEDYEWLQGLEHDAFYPRFVTKVFCENCLYESKIEDFEE